MRRTAVIAAAVLCTSTAAAQVPEIYQFDVTHGYLEFRVRLAGFNRVRGTFDSYRGDALVIPGDTLKSIVSLSIDVGSIQTGSNTRDEHLRSADFFDAAQWPGITFLSTRVERDGRDYAAVGPLTIRDVTREVRVPFSIVAPKGVDPFGNTRFAVAGRITINRRDFGVIGPAFWNRAIGDSVEIEFETPGRQWNYERMAFSRESAAQLLIDGIAAKRLDAAIADGWNLFQDSRGDSTMNFGWFEYLKAAGRLSLAGKTRESASVLDLGARVSEAAGRPKGAANLRAALSEAYLRLDDRTRAEEQAAAALALDPRNSTAMLLRAYLSR